MTAIDASLSSILKGKLRAFAIHIGITLPIYIALVLVIKFIWYPDFYFKLLDVLPILAMLFGIDVILGPLLTFIIYKKNKPSLKFDISVIALVQLAAFVFGISVMYKERPLFLVYAVDSFIIVTASDINTEELKPELLLGKSPKIINAKLPESAQERSDLTMSFFFKGIDIEYRPKLYRPINTAKEALHKAKIPLHNLPNQKVIQERNPSAQLAAYPLTSMKDNDHLAIFDLDKYQIIEVLDIDPWEVKRASSR